ncbi:glycoside hydrolase family 32 protein [Planctomyces sp. SH-PL62]|uniref:glycoside hydrolase family 32 protein n=1 Tax=Planctomyces sp. SH-PL62 TaxID=1636152 RepID=UPI00078B412C|nr:glycoside hydrolase family 32 protein [Planctomyces sp. SH-PL62]AMV40679.1 Levanase precursor [Planctomyces sp. SH-PL62]
MLATMVLAGLLAATTTTEDAARPDVLIADFEGPDYGGWNATGDAFGEAPARGTLPGQMTVEGYRGEGLVNSFRGGDDATGELISPPFRIERKALNFLIGGGGWAGETCLDLLVDGRVVRSAAGPNRESGGSERLRWDAWDVSDLQGKEATLRVVDRRKGGWGHINVDHIVQTDAPRLPARASKAIALTHRYLSIPVKTGAPKVRARILDDAGKILREFDVELAPPGVEPDFLAFSDLEAQKGKTLTVRVDELEDAKALDRIGQSDADSQGTELYKEPLRPQFHFTSRRGWLNDPNGLVWQDGEYHLFYQHNPFGWGWGNMHWGHAVSPDLVRWRELPIALYPHQYGDWAFSGSAVVDHRNTSGFQKGDEPPIVAAYTSTGRGECLVFSNDRGRTWTEFEGNPVVKHEGRDPRLVWYAPGKHWVMAVYDEGAEPKRQSIDFYTSPDLKAWTFASRLDGFYECPDLIELAVDGDPSKTLWVVYAADGKYKLGTFDGKTFTPTSGPEKLAFRHGNFYAAQTFSDEPKGRCVQVGWANGVTFPGAPFNQQMSLPAELTLRTTPDGPRLFAEPVPELKELRAGSCEFSRTPLEPGAKNPLDRASHRLLSFSPRSRLQIPISSKSVKDIGRAEDYDREACEIELTFRPGAAKFLELDLLGTPLIYDVERQDVVCKQVRTFVPQVDGVVRLHVFVDKGSVEAFANGGRTTISVADLPAVAEPSLGIAAKGGTVMLEKLTVHRLRSAWEAGPSR